MLCQSWYKTARKKQSQNNLPKIAAAAKRYYKNDALKVRKKNSYDDEFQTR